MEEPVVLNNRYRLLELIGSGGMAVVYRGVDTLLERQVAVKVLRESFSGDPAFLARFRREARAAANLDHANVVTVYDVGQDGDRHYIVMEYVDGRDLKTLIRQKDRLDVDETLDIAIQIAAGVGHAHKANFIHCDVKPQNVLVTHDGRVKVTDFGIARALSESELTESETVWGSPFYFSPEQAAGDPPSPASDVYSIGCVMYEMLTGSPPFRAEKPAALALMHMREEPTPIAARNPQVPPQLEWIVRKVMAKEPSARYRNADQLAHVLEEYGKHGEQATTWQPAAPSTDAKVQPQQTARLAPETDDAALLAEADRLTWALGIIALLLVLGLIPWWMIIYNAWQRSGRPTQIPTRVSTPLVTLTPVVQQVTVPDLVGLPIDEARREAERRGLTFVVAEERGEPGAEQGIVLEQTPAAGTRAPFESQVSVVISKIGRELTVYDMVGLPVDVVEQGLESDGLNVVVEPVWSAEMEGMVLEQEPPPDTTVHASDTVTLTVSGGLDVPIPLEVNFSDTIMLERAELDQVVFQPGDEVSFVLYWRALREVSRHYRVFVHLQGSGGPSTTPVAYGDADPVISSTLWTPGEGSDVIVKDAHEILVPVGLSAGRYQLRVGLYIRESGQRLAVLDPGLAEVEMDSILIAAIEVTP